MFCDNDRVNIVLFFQLVADDLGKKCFDLISSSSKLITFITYVLKIIAVHIIVFLLCTNDTT